MFRFSLKHSSDDFIAPKSWVAELSLFKSEPALLDRGRYTIQSNVRREVFESFMMRVCHATGSEPVNSDNAMELQMLCDEFGFTGLDAEIRAVLGDEKSATRRELVLMRGRMDRYDVLLERLQRQVFELQSQLNGGEKKDTKERQLDADVEGLSATVSALTASVGQVLGTMEEKASLADVRELLDEKASAADLKALQEELARLKRDETKRDTKPAPAAPLQAQPKPAGTEFVCSSAKPLDGILAHLTNQCGGNVHDKKEVNVTASSVSYIYDSKNAADARTHLSFWSNDEPNSWICYDFKDRRVTPTSYSLRSCGGGPGSLNIKSWVFEASNNGTSWHLLDSHINNNDLDDKSVTHNFPIKSNPGGQSYRFFRIRQTGANHYGTHVLQLSAFEIFGFLYSK